jgi:spermidine/putrescine transport system permease protein
VKAFTSRRLGDAALRVFVILCLIFLFMPVVLVILFSFSSRPLASFPISGLSLRWYQSAFGDTTTVEALLASIKLAVLSSVVAAAVGTAAAYALVRANKRLAAGCTLAISTPLVLPLLVIGIALVTAFDALHVRFSLWTAFCGHLVLVLPLAFAIVAARLGRFDWSIEEASRDLGARPWYTFWHVTFPAMRPAIIGAIAIAAAFSLDEFVVTFFTIGVGNTLPTVLWSRLRTTVDPSINAIGTALLVGTAVLTAIAARFGRVRL